LDSRFEQYGPENVPSQVAYYGQFSFKNCCSIYSDVGPWLGFKAKNFGLALKV